MGDPRVDFLAEPQRLDPLLRSFTRSHFSSPNTWGDAYLATVARALDLQLVSFDRVFLS